MAASESASATSGPMPVRTCAILGHSLSGKSTLSGHLLLQCGALDRRSAQQAEKDAAKQPSARFSCVVDRPDERDKLTTSSLKLLRLPIPAAHTAAAEPSTAPLPSALTLLDTPGDYKYLHATIAGILHADCAVLVVDCRQAIVEAPSNSAQTRDLGALAVLMSAHRSLVVAVNQLDTAYDANAAEARFNAAREAVLHQLKRHKDSITFVPCSAYLGDNLTAPSPKLAWWSGPTLLGAMLKAAARAEEKAAAGAPAGGGGGPLPPRIPVLGCCKVGGMGTVALGRVVGGPLPSNTPLCILPRPRAPSLPAPSTPAGAAAPAPIPPAHNHAAAGAAASAASASPLPPPVARTIESYHEQRPEAGVGECVGVCIKGWPAAALRRGLVLAAASSPPVLAASFTAKIQVLRGPQKLRQRNNRHGLRVGSCPLVHVHAAQVPCRVAKVLARYDARGAVKMEKPDDDKLVFEGEMADVVLVPLAPLVVEPFGAYPALGRFVLRAAMPVELGGARVWMPVIVGVGRVQAVTPVVEAAPSSAPQPDQTHDALGASAAEASAASTAAGGGGGVDPTHAPAAAEPRPDSASANADVIDVT